MRPPPPPGPTGLPRRRRRTARTAPIPQAGTGGLVTEARATILVDDDQSPVRRILQSVLEALGYRVLTATGGADALHIATMHAGRLDLLLTDVSMPGMDGPELADRLAAVRPDVPVLFISGDRCFRPPACLTTRVFGFLPKPFTPRQLGEQVRGFLAA